MTLSTVQDIYDLVGAEEDEHGCLIPTVDEVLRDSVARYRYLRLRKAYAEAVGLGEDRLFHITWRLAHDRQEIPQEMHLSHECGNRYENKRCINHKHLHIRTPSENHSFKDPEMLTRVGKLGSKALAKKFEENPDFKAAMYDKVRATNKTHETIERRYEGAIRAWTPERREQTSIRSKKSATTQWQNDDVRTRMVAGLRKIYRCDVCGYERTATSVGRHQSKTYHVGRTLVTEETA